VTLAISYQLPTAAAGVQPWVSLWEICCGLVDNGTSLPMSTTVSPCQYHSIIATCSS